MSIKSRIRTKFGLVTLLLFTLSVAGLAQKVIYAVKKPLDKGQVTKAEKKLKKIYAHDSSTLEYYYYMGEITRSLGYYKQAEKYFNKVLEMNPGSVFATEGLGKAYAQEGLITKAITQLNTAIAMDSTSASAYSDLGAAYIVMNDYETALPYLLKAYKHNLKSPALLYNLGITYSQLERYDTAVYFLSKSLKKYKNRRAYGERGYAYYRLDKDRKALRDYNKALRMRATEVAWNKQGIGEIYYWRAQVWKDLGNRAKYLKDMMEAKENGYN